jgi:hypothetical protein
MGVDPLRQLSRHPLRCGNHFFIALQAKQSNRPRLVGPVDHRILRAQAQGSIQVRKRLFVPAGESKRLPDLADCNRISRRKFKSAFGGSDSFVIAAQADQN